MKAASEFEMICMCNVLLFCWILANIQITKYKDKQKQRGRYNLIFIQQIKNLIQDMLKIKNDV